MGSQPGWARGTGGRWSNENSRVGYSYVITDDGRFLKGQLQALSQSCVRARCALTRCLVLLATLESSWLLSAHQPANSVSQQTGSTST